MASNAINVFVKVRPLIDREMNENSSSVWRLSGNTLKSTDKQYEMTFDNIYDETRTTEELFNVLAKPIVRSGLQGINGTIFAYGQTSSGKTYTMTGDDKNPGIIPLTVEEIFENIESIENREFLIRVGYIEIYNEKIYDLLEEKRVESGSCKVWEPTPGDVAVQQIELLVKSKEEIMKLYDRGNRSRRIGVTNMNERSSRSHAIFRITIESRELGKTCKDSAVQVSHLNLVDLAGSERADQTKSEGERLKEGGHINKSLLALGNVIRFLSDDSSNPPAYINYRDSKLTRILSASLGGNAMTSIICTVTPAALDETYSTLVFAQNAKKIKNKPKVNEVLNDQAIMKRMQREIQTLKTELDLEKTRNNALQIKQISDKISIKEGQFLHSHNVSTSLKVAEVNRRKTWCPSTAVGLPLSALPSAPGSFLLNINDRNSVPSHSTSPDLDEIFMPSHEVNLDRTLSPGDRNTDMLSGLIHTPREMKYLRPPDDSPNPMKIASVEGMQSRIKYLEEEIQELNDFKKIENSVGEDHRKLCQRLAYANDHNASLELKIEELEAQLAKKNDTGPSDLIAAKDKALKAKEEAENIQKSVEYEYEAYKERAKKREQELIKYLDEARNESKNEALLETIKSLEEKLKESEELLMSVKAKEEITHFSIEPDSLESSAAPFSSEIFELKQTLETVIDERNRFEKSLLDKRQELSRVMNEFDEISTQLMDSIQDNEKLMETIEAKTRRVEELETIQQANENDVFQQQEFESLSLKCQVIDEILINIRNNTEISPLDAFDDDESIQTLIELHSAMLSWKQNEVDLNELQTEIAHLNNENSLLRMKLPTIEESFVESENELKDKVDKSNFELEQLKDKLETEEANSAEMKENIDRLKQELAVSKELIQTMQTEMDTQKTEISSPSTETDQLVRDLQLKLSESNSKCVDLNDQLEKLRTDLEDKSNKVKELEESSTAQAAEMSSEIAELKEGLTEIMTLGEENARLKEVEKQVNRMSSELKLKVEEIEEKTEEIKAAKGIKEIQAQRIHELKQNETNMKMKFEQMEVEVAQKNEMIMILEADKEMLTIVQEKLKRAVQDANDAKEQSLELEIQMHDLQQELTSNQKQLHEKMKDIQNMSLNASHEFELIAQKALNEQQIEDLQQKLKESAGEIEALGIEVELLKSGAEESLKDKIDELEREVEVLQQERKSSQDRISSLLEFEKKSEQLETELKECKTEVETSTGELEIFKQKFEDLQKILATRDRSIKILEDYIKDKDQEIGELQKNMEVVSKDSKETENLKKQLAEAEEKRNQLNETNSQVEELKAQVADLMNQLEESSESVNRLNETAVELQEVKTAFESVKAQLEETSEKSLELKNQMQADLDRKQTEINNMLNQLSDYEQKVQQLSDATLHLETLQAEISSLNQQKAARDGEFNQLAFKVTELESNCNDGNERFKLLERDFTKIEAENTNLKSKLLINQEAMNALDKQLKDRVNESDEIKARLRRRSSDNDRKFQVLEEEKNELMHKVGACEAQKAILEQELQQLKREHLHVRENQMPKLLDEIVSLKNSSNDNDVKFTVLHEQYSQLREENQELEKRIVDLNKAQSLKSQLEANEKLEKQLASLYDQMKLHATESITHTTTIESLREELKHLKEELEESKTLVDQQKEQIESTQHLLEEQKRLNFRKTASPDKRLDELFVSQNQQLLLEAHRSTPSRAIERNVERKNRRQSVHDQSRRLSAWERFTDSETQTEDVSEICACSELAQKVKELQIEVRKRDCKVSNMERLALHNPLKIDIEELKKQLIREQRDHNHSKASHDVLVRNMIKLESKLEILSKNQFIPKEKASIATQASDETAIDKAEYEMLEKKLNDLKRILRTKQEKILEFEREAGKEKENVSSNFAKGSDVRAIEAENASLKKKLQEIEEKSQTDDVKASAKSDLDNIRDELETLKKKYDMTRRLCNLRNDDISKLKLELGVIKEKYEQLEVNLSSKIEENHKILEKYAKVKELCQIRLDKINDLRAQTGQE